MSHRKRMPSYRPWGYTEDGAIEFESLTSETMEGAMTVMREAFYTDENVCIAVDLLSEAGAYQELDELCRDAIMDGVSIVAIEVATGEVVGASLNKIQVRDESSEKGSFELFSERCKYKSSKRLVDYMISMDSKVDLFGHYNVDCILELMFLATKRNHRQSRIGELLVSASIELGRQLNRGKKVKTPIVINGVETISNENCIPTLASALMTSTYSKRLADRVGFDTLAEVSYDDFTIGDKKFSERIDSSQKYSWLVAKRLTNTKIRTI